jgi:hypothetical protein
MKRLVPAALLLLVAAYGYSFAQTKPQSAMPPKKPSSPMFDQIKALAGEWQGKMSDGTVSRTSYRVVSNGSAVMNVLDPAGEMEMVTMFHQDGAALMATHYCAMGNQPRMVAASAAKPNVIEFTFKDVTNLTSPNEGHMSGLVLTMTDADHHQQEWIFRQDGKEQRAVFEFTRKR